jgi:hypothetical protein
MPQLEVPPAPPQGTLAARRDLDKNDNSGSWNHNTKPSEEQEPEAWVTRPITRDTARGYHLHDSLDTLLRRAFDRHTWSIEYRCVVYQHSRGLYLDQWEATCLVHRLDDDLQGAESDSENYSITERDTAEAAMQDVVHHALSQYCSLFSGVADSLDLKYYPRRSTGSTGGVIVSPLGEGNPRLSSMVNMVTVLNTKLDHALDESGKARADITELHAKRAECLHQEDGSSAPWWDSAPLSLTAPWSSCLWHP